VEEIKAHAQKINWLPQSPIARNRVDFLAHLKGLLIGRNPAKGIFKDQKFFHPGLDFFIEFPAGWKTINTPEMVGAIAPDKDGVMFLGLQGKGADAEKSAKSFIDGLNKEYEIEPSESKPVKIGEMDGYLVTLTDSTGKEPVHMHFLWVAKQGLIYQMIGLAPQHHRETLKTSALSFGSLKPEQRASIMEIRLDIVSAKLGESLAQLSSRTGNIWDLPTTALMNEMSTDQSLKQGEPVKVAVSQKYIGQ
jgi:predicted Zn-dependent protease